MANFYKCDECGNILLAMGPDAEPCKNSKIEFITPGTSDGAAEKHVPVVTFENNQVVVRVGSVPHPMTPEHYIEWVFIKTTAGGTYCHLTPDDEPEVMFPLQPEEVVSVYEYCNIHGLWKAAEPPLPNFFDTNDVACSPEFSAGCINPLTDKD